MINAATNILTATSGANVLSPGGIELLPGPNPLKEDDDLTLTFIEPVAAVGFDILFQGYDFCSAVAITIRDPQGALLFQNSLLRLSTAAGGGAPGGKEFIGFISRRSNIKTIVVSEFDGNNEFPDSNIGFDTFRIQQVLPNTAVSLNGSVSDDGLPAGGQLTSGWSKVSGTGTVTFADISSPTTAVTFSEAGQYILRLTADDSELTSFDEVAVSARVGGEPPANQSPQVNAGSDQTVTLSTSANLFAIVTDDGLPAGSSVSVEWSLVSGPGTATFGSANSTETSVAFSETGVYVLRLTATDTVTTVADEITLTVLDATAANRPPTADAGSDQVVTLNANLVKNPSAEAELTGGELPDWTNAAGSGWTRSEDETANIPGARFGKHVFSAGGAAQSEMSQDIDIRAYAEGVNAGTQAFEWKAYVRSLPETSPDSGRIVIEYRDTTNKKTLGILNSGDVASTDGWHLTEDVRVPPAGTGWIRIRLLASRHTGATNDVFIDGLSLKAVGNPAALKLNGTVTDDGLPAGSVLRSIWTKVAGNGIVTFGNANAIESSARFATTGSYTLQLTATDGALLAKDQMTVAVSAANQPPVVSAGAAQTVSLPSTVQLNGSATDDGALLNHRWTKASGPGLVSVSNPKVLNPTATFSLAGNYILRLTAEDGELEESDVVAITINPAPANQPPAVEAGNNQTIRLPVKSVNLRGIVTDDGKPNDSLRITWSKIAGSGDVSFTNANAARTGATFDAAGSYILRLTASDGQDTAWDEVAIVVNPANGGGGQNQPPVVVIGADQIVGLAQTAILEALSITDDGLRVGGSSTSQWSKVSGDGNVTFSNPNDTATFATFNRNGTYVLRLTVSDSELSGSDELTVTVIDNVPAPAVEILTPEDGISITEPTAISGTVSGGTWKLEYSLTDTDNPNNRVWTTFGTGTGAASGNLGSLDTTLMLNGLYDARLSAADERGLTSTDIISISVEKNLKVGHFTVSFEDMNVPVAGIPIQVIRTYDSRDKRKGEFGFGWTLGIKNVRVEKNNVLGLRWFQTRSNTFIPTYCVEATRRHIVTVTMQDGEVNKFEARLDRQCQLAGPISQARLIFTPQAGTRGTLSVTGDNTVFVAGSVPGPVDLVAFDSTGIFDRTQFKYTAKDGREFVINLGGGLQSVKDTNGNTVTVSANGITHSSGVGITFTRDNQGRLTAVTDPAGVSNVYAYSTDGDLISYRDRENNTTAFTYEPTIAHHLKSIADPLGRTPIRNEYDASGRLLKHIDANGGEIIYTHNLAARSEKGRDRLGNQTIYIYDDRGNVLEKTDALGKLTSYSYDANDKLLTETNALGKTTTYSYDGFDNRTSVTDALGNRTEFTYNSQGRVLTSKDARHNVTTNTYDTAGNLLTTTDALGNVTTNTYSIFDGQLRGTTDALNNKTAYEYFNGLLKKETDAHGNETTYGYDANGNRNSQTVRRTNALGQSETITTGLEYDNLNRLTKTTLVDGSFTQVEYNELGQQKATIDQAGTRTESVYDTLGRLTKTTYPDGKFEESTYDPEGRRLNSKDRAGRVTSYQYDALGRLKKTAYPDGTFTTTNYDAAGRVTSNADARGKSTTYEYDPNCGCSGRTSKIINALGQITTFTYDANDNQISMTDARGNTTNYEFDALDRQIKAVYPDGTLTQVTFDTLGRKISSTDQAGRVTGYSYDSLGRLTKVRDALGQETRYGYNELGQQISQTDANNNITRYEYDKLGRRIKRILPLGQVEAYNYDNLGNLKTRTDFNGKTTTFNHDSMGRLLAKIPDASLNEPTVSLIYNDLGQRATMTDASGVTQYAYDVRNRLTSKQTPFGTLSYTYDEASNIGMLRSSNQGGGSIDYFYDDLNRVEAVKDSRLPNGANTTTYVYNEAGSLSTVVLPNGVTTTYNLDSLNRLTSLRSAKNSNTIASYAYTLGASGNRTQVVEQTSRTVNYSYDHSYRLTQETVTNSAISGMVNYNYDPVGNRLSRNSSVNQVLNQSWTYDPNDRLNSDAYDGNGNTTVIRGTNYNYDFENKLTSTGDVQIIYDGDGNRASKIVNGIRTDYLVDTNNLTGYAQVVEEVQNDQVVKAYTYGNDLISQRQAANGNIVNFYNYDGHGSVRQLTDGTGSVTDTYTYDAFGNLTERTGTTDNNYLYVGEQFDSDLGFFYNRARYLNVQTGRFISLDTFEGIQFEPRSLHKYLYVGNNPVNSIDPSGRAFAIAAQSVNVTLNSIVSAASTTLAVAAVAAVACAVEAGVTNTLNELDADVEGLTPCAVKGPKDYVRFVHGTSMLSAITINTVGVEYDAIFNSGTDSWYPGAFFTFLLEPNPSLAMDLAAVFAQRKGPAGARALVIGRLPRRTFNRLESSGAVNSKPLIGADYDETVFVPQSFVALNYHNRGRWEIIPK